MSERILLIKIATRFLAMALVLSGKLFAEPAVVITEFRDDRVKCYCSTDKLEGFRLDASEIKKAYAGAGLPIAVVAEHNNILMIRLPGDLQDEYLASCKAGDTANSQCWLKSSAVSTSANVEVVASRLENRKRPCSESGTFMGSEACSQGDTDK